MEKKIKYLTIAVIALSVVSLVTLISLIYGNRKINNIPPRENPEFGEMRKMDRPGRNTRVMSFMDHRLNLNEEQKLQIQSNRDLFFKSSRDNMNRFRDARMELRKAYLNNASEEEIDEKLKNISELAVENEKALIVHYKSISEVLSEEQKVEFLKLIDSAECRMHRRRPMHNGNEHRRRHRNR